MFSFGYLKVFFLFFFIKQILIIFYGNHSIYNHWCYKIVADDPNTEDKSKDKQSKGVDMFAEDADMFAENYNVNLYFKWHKINSNNSLIG